MHHSSLYNFRTFGTNVGTLVGWSVGLLVGVCVGGAVGTGVPPSGAAVYIMPFAGGRTEGSLGALVGMKLGVAVGVKLGVWVGRSVGVQVGSAVGLAVGAGFLCDPNNWTSASVSFRCMCAWGGSQIRTNRPRNRWHETDVAWIGASLACWHRSHGPSIDIPIPTRKPDKREAQQSALFQTITFLTNITGPKSAIHQGFSSASVCVQLLPMNWPFVLPSSARIGPASYIVDDWYAALELSLC